MKEQRRSTRRVLDTPGERKETKNGKRPEWLLVTRPDKAMLLPISSANALSATHTVAAPPGGEPPLATGATDASAESSPEGPARGYSSSSEGPAEELRAPATFFQSKRRRGNTKKRKRCSVARCDKQSTGSASFRGMCHAHSTATTGKRRRATKQRRTTTGNWTADEDEILRSAMTWQICTGRINGR